MIAVSLLDFLPLREFIRRLREMPAMQTETAPAPAPAPRGVIHHDMTREQYDALDAVNFSTLKLFAKSPAHYWHRLMEGGDADTNAKKLGRVRHMAVFEPERFRREVVAWDGGRRFGKEWDAFCAKHAGREIVTADEMSEVIRLATHVRTDRVAGRYVTNGRPEVTYQWTHSAPAADGVPAWSINLKGRVDFVTDTHLADLKTCRDASPGAFGRAVWDMHYLAQAAMYVDGHEAATGQRLGFAFVAAEIDVPHVVTVFRVADHLLDRGRDMYQGWLYRLAECRRTATWPGFATEEIDIQLPPWAAPANEDDEDASGMGLDFTEEAAQ